MAEAKTTFFNNEEDFLMHYGKGHLDGGHSGRYPWGSGDDSYQRTGTFYDRVDKMRKEGFTWTDENGKSWTGDAAIYKSMGLTSGQFRTEYALSKDEVRMAKVARIKELQAQGMGATAIGKEMDLPESTIRSLLNEQAESRMKQARATADIIRKRIDETNGPVDVGNGVEIDLNVSKEKMQQALYLLEREGYVIHKGGIPQVTNKGQQTNQVVICPPGTEWKEIYNFDKISTLKEYISRDGGDSFEKKFHYPASLDSKRLMIRYKDDAGPDGITGIQKDGLIELRRGVDDLSLGESRYSQVRILVDGTHYLKGMAVYSDNLPDGVDVVFNTNKSREKGLYGTLKEIKKDPDNPFGSAIKDVEQGGQYWYTDKKTGEKKLGLINKRASEGDWSEWADKLPSQFLGKQSKNMVEKQLNLAKADKQAEFDEIMSLTNPTIKKHFLRSFAEDCDSAAVHLKAAALPGQKYKVMIPINTLKDNEVYAPGYEDGTKLALIRYPHGGTFEIPICTVNNKHKPAIDILTKTATDAVGVNSRVAERLSGADFDGDTVMCIPTHDKAGKVKITSTKKLKGLEGFDSKSYAYTDEEIKSGKAKIMKNTQTQMGIISNLITDMTIKGATEDELARAVRHSMVVIDAEKHKLNYKQSEKDNNIAALQKEYQSYVDANGKLHTKGASTLLSRAKGEIPVDKRQGSPKVNIKGKEWYDPNKPEGALIYKTADDLYYQQKKVNKKTGEEYYVSVKRTQKSTRMAETDDAYTLISDVKDPREVLYADYANAMKRMANEARKEAEYTGKIATNESAKRAYKAEIESLNAKLNTSLSNHPRERQAQRLANAEVKAKQAANPTMTKGDVKKASQQALTKYRQQVGAKREPIEINDREWEAIQAGAISEAKLTQILNHADKDKLRERATPRVTSVLSQAKINRIKAMSNSNYSLNDIAKALGVSASTVSKYLKGAN